MKIFSAEQTHRADAYTIQNEGIASIELTERASNRVYRWLKKKFTKETHFDVFCGPGNNGGDGLAVARMLLNSGFSVNIYYLDIGNPSKDNQLNQEAINDNVALTRLDRTVSCNLESEGVVIDAVFGSGLSRPITGWIGEIINKLSKNEGIKVSIDIASGLFSENNDENEGVIFQPDYTLTFELEKLAFQFPENQKYVGALKVLPIGLSSEFISTESTPHFISSKLAVKQIHKLADSFAYKNTFGHALLVTGSTGKMGAAVLCAKASLRAGTGLVTAHIPKNGNEILQVSVPEVMTIPDRNRDVVSDEIDVSNYSSIGVGPGLGQSKEVLCVLKYILEETKNPLVIDADAINIISSNKELLKVVPTNSIFTPHLGEWKRLVGEWSGAYHRLKLAQEFCKTHKLYVVLKGAKSAIVCPDGDVHFNSTGNPGMATAGSGDVLTGILTGLLAQEYTPKQAAILGVFVHGLAGDLALKNGCRESLIASDIIDHLGLAFKKVRE